VLESAMASTSKSERSRGGEEEAVQWRRRWGIPPLAVPPSRSARVRTVESVAQVAVANLVLYARGPHSLLYGTVRRGPTNLVGLDAPDQGADQGSS
jgi:hypothetical protein